MIPRGIPESSNHIVFILHMCIISANTMQMHALIAEQLKPVY